VVSRPPVKRARGLPPIADGSPVLLPSLGKHLPPLWSVIGATSEKAAKADDAEISYAMWNNRITPLFPSFTPAVLDKLRALVLRKYRRRLFKEFLFYLRKTFKRILSRFLQSYDHLYDCLYAKRLGGLISHRSTYVIGTKCSSLDAYEIESIKNYLASDLFIRLREEIRLGLHSLHCLCESSFFSWNSGSALFFWRWENSLHHIAKFGFAPQLQDELPSNFRKPRKPSQLVRDKILSKILKSIKRGYLIPASLPEVKNLIDYFAVPKADDIRLVLNGSSCGLNSSTWASNFWLPNSNTMVRQLGFNYKSVDLDLGEMFLNFPLSPLLRSYSGMDVTFFKDEIEKNLPWFHFESTSKRAIVVNTRNWMGLRPSPEWSCKFYYLAEEFLRGNERSPNNPLRWDRIILNLIGQDDYIPSYPNVMKWNDLEDRQAGNIIAYVDDLRVIGWDLNHAWNIAHLVASRIQFLGIQDASRKRRIDNGPWAGSVFKTSTTRIQKTVTSEKWLKAKGYVKTIRDMIDESKDQSLNYKFLERVRGFLCHLALTYDIIFPYLKGFHLTLCSYLPKRDEAGWKMKDLEWIAHLQSLKANNKISDIEIEQALNFKYDPKSRPTSIIPVPRFYSCLKALETFFEMDTPPVMTERTNQVQLVIYGFVDASKSGFGSSMDYASSIKYRIGTWSSDTDDESSNFREFNNLVETLEFEASKNRLNDSTIIMATDNSTVESCIFKGNSSNEKLFNLIVRFKNLQLKTGSKFIVTHVSGKRMQAQGTDGISRGHLREGVSLGKAMLTYCPWNLNALQRHPPLKESLYSIFGPGIEFLSPSDWFTRGHDHKNTYTDDFGFHRINVSPGVFIWHPPPAAADAALEELRKARLKRQDSTHIVIIPRLFTTSWLRQLHKTADIVFHLPNCHSFWPKEMLEPLTFGILFPYSKHYPWQLRGTPKLFHSQRQVHRMLQEDHLDGGSVLRELYSSLAKIPTLSARMVRRVLFFGSKHQVSRPPSRGGNKRRKPNQ